MSPALQASVFSAVRRRTILRAVHLPGEVRSEAENFLHGRIGHGSGNDSPFPWWLHDNDGFGADESGFAVHPRLAAYLEGLFHIRPDDAFWDDRPVADRIASIPSSVLVDTLAAQACAGTGVLTLEGSLRSEALPLCFGSHPILVPCTPVTLPIEGLPTGSGTFRLSPVALEYLRTTGGSAAGGTEATALLAA